MNIYGDIKKKSTALKIAGGFAFVISFIMAMYSKNYLYVGVSFLILLATFLEKEYIVNANGVNIAFSFFNIKSDFMWLWSDIDTVHCDYVKKYPKVILHFGKDVVVRSFVFEARDVENIIMLAKRANPSIYIKK